MQFSGVEYNDDGQDDFYEPMDKSMGGYSGGHMSGPQNYPYYGGRGGNYGGRYEDYSYVDGPGPGPSSMWNDQHVDSWRGKDHMTFSLHYKHQDPEHEKSSKCVGLNLALSVPENKTIRVLVYEGDDVTQLALRLVGFLNTHGLLKLHPEHHELLHRSFTYFIENKMSEIGVPIQTGSYSLVPQSMPMPTIEQ